MKFILLLLAVMSPAWAFADVSEVAASVAAGKTTYSQTCVACHGANGKGTIPGVRDLTKADGPLAKSDKELANSILNGFQTPGSAMAMPPKGGNPVLTIDDIRSVLAYLRTEFGK